MSTGNMDLLYTIPKISTAVINGATGDEHGNLYYPTLNSSLVFNIKQKEIVDILPFPGNTLWSVQYLQRSNSLIGSTLRELWSFNSATKSWSLVVASKALLDLRTPIIVSPTLAFGYQSTYGNHSWAQISIPSGDVKYTKLPYNINFYAYALHWQPRDNLVHAIGWPVSQGNRPFHAFTIDPVTLAIKDLFTFNFPSPSDDSALVLRYDATSGLWALVDQQTSHRPPTAYVVSESQKGVIATVNLSSDVDSLVWDNL
jgi:hypothetical protein